MDRIGIDGRGWMTLASAVVFFAMTLATPDDGVPSDESLLLPVGVASAALLWFAGALFSVLRGEDGTDSAPAAVALGSGVLIAAYSGLGAVLLVAPGLGITEAAGVPADRGSAVFAEAASNQLIHIATFWRGSLLAAVGIVASRSPEFPRWFGWLSLVLAAGSIAGALSFVASTVASIATMVGYSSFIAFHFWVLVAGIVVARRQRRVVRIDDPSRVRPASRRGSAGITAALAAVLAVAALGVVPARAHSGAETARIAFASSMAGNLDIWSIGADGSRLARLTTDDAPETFPAWSPDGRRIAFVRGSRFGREIFVMDADGNNVLRLTTNAVADVQPAWSPDGSKLVFVRFGADLDRDLWIMSADGTEETQLTDHPARFDVLPDWSPRGDSIAFESDRSGAVAVYTIRPDGSGLRKLTSDALQGGAPAWSPDGRQLAFIENFCGECPADSDLLVMNASGGHIRQLAEISPLLPIEDAPTWDPDGERLAFGAADATQTNFDVYVVDVDDGRLTNVTEHDGAAVVSAMPDWGPDSFDP